jgi:hypothetical protein
MSLDRHQGSINIHGPGLFNIQTLTRDWSDDAEVELEREKRMVASWEQVSMSVNTVKVWLVLSCGRDAMDSGLAPWAVEGHLGGLRLR